MECGVVISKLVLKICVMLMCLILILMLYFNGVINSDEKVYR